MEKVADSYKKNKFPILFLIAFLLLAVPCNAQVAVSTAGTTLNNAAGEVSYTIGQSVYSEVELPSMMVYHGVQQPFCQTSYDTIRALVCPNSTFTDYNFNITAGETSRPGSYTFSQSLTNYGGCDSLVTLMLTVKALSVDEDAVVECDRYVWRGVEYTEGFDSVMVMPDVDGCDSTITFHLTINHSSTYEFEDQASFVYTWNAETYRESGIYQQTFTNQYGCDSVATLDLTIIDKPLPIIYTYDKRVLVVDHYPENQQERVDYSSYRWYRDNVRIANSGLDQYFEEGYPLLHGCYYVMVPADPTQIRWVKSNVICMDRLDIEEVESRGIEFLVAPNPVLSGHDLEVSLINIDESDLHKLRMTLFDNAGRTLQDIDVKSARFKVNMPYGSGYYTLYVRHEDGRFGVKKIIVHR